MKRLLFLALPLLMAGCQSTSTYNREIQRLKSPDELRADVDYTYGKITRLHPDLYWYISEPDFRHKFDSLKATLTEPLDSYAFYERLAPLVASVRQGHMILRPPVPQLDKKQTKALMAKGKGPFSQFDFGLIGDTMYVLKNRSYDNSIPAGAKVLSINGQPLSQMLGEYGLLFASDGFNTTFKRRRLEKQFGTLYSAKHGLMDSLTYEFRIADSTRWVTILRKETDTTKKKTVATKTGAVKKEKKKRIPRSVRVKKGFNPETGLFNRELQYVGADSSVALLKIRGFSIGNYRKFYKETFRELKQKNVRSLVIDLRDNGGGRLSEILYLYGFLADSSGVVCHPARVTSRGSLLRADYFRDATIIGKAIRGVFAPLFYGVQFFRVHKAPGGGYVADAASEVKTKKGHFDGPVYVLINGGSFSASALFSAMMKGSGRAVFVGEETGGAYNGTVAGQMPTFTLPNSKVDLRIGLMTISTIYQTQPDGRGVFPDKEIVPTIQDRLSGRDPELDWVLDDIRNHGQSTAVLQH